MGKGKSIILGSDVSALASKTLPNSWHIVLFMHLSSAFAHNKLFILINVETLYNPLMYSSQTPGPSQVMMRVFLFTFASLSLSCSVVKVDVIVLSVFLLNVSCKISYLYY